MAREYRIRAPIKLEVVETFGDRPGFTIVASVRSEDHLLEYACTAPQATPQEAMEALFLWVRESSIEDNRKG